MVTIARMVRFSEVRYCPSCQNCPVVGPKVQSVCISPMPVSVSMQRGFMGQTWQKGALK